MKSTFNLGGLMKSRIEVILKSKDGEELSKQVFENTYTYAFAGRLLATLVQASGSAHISPIGWAKKLALSSGSFPYSPADSDLSDIEDYVDLSSVVSITETSKVFTVTRTASWTNGTGAPVNITYLAQTFDTSVAKDQVFCLANLPTPETVNDGQVLQVNYTNSVTKDTSYWSPV